MKIIRQFGPCRPINLMVRIVIALAAMSCASGPAIVGNWRALEGAATVNFTSDGVFQAVDTEGMAVSGKYRMVAADKIQFEFRHDGEGVEVVDAKVIREGERLILIFPGEDAMETYERIP
jgi:hypothetical protein